MNLRIRGSPSPAGLCLLKETMMTDDLATLYQRPVELLQRLIRFNTTNPPGNEAACIGFIQQMLHSVGIETTLLEKVPNRPNLIARLSGTGNQPPLLLYGHVDVVTTEGQQWSHSPFNAEIADGFIWGRGTLDMKGGVAMLLAAFMRAKVEKVSLPGDVVLCIVSDEEAGGDIGARFLVEEHPTLFKDIRYALGEFGGFTLYLGGKRFYPIMVAEKQICWLRMTMRGPAGHGSMPIRGGAMAKTAKILHTLDKKLLPVHITPPVCLMFETMASHLAFPVRTLLTQLLNPALSNSVLNLLGTSGQVFLPLLHNTVSPTILRGSDKINVIPPEVVLELDGRLLPGFKPDDIVRELRGLLGNDLEIEVKRYDPGPAEPDMGLFNGLAKILQTADPQGIPIPLVLSGVTDGRYFARLGIQTYGFLPMPLPPDFNFSRTIHAADERIPLEAVSFGTNAIFQAVQQFGG